MIVLKRSDLKVARSQTEIALYAIGASFLFFLILSPIILTILEIPGLDVPWLEILSLEQRTLTLLVRTLALAASAAATSTLLGMILAFTMKFWPEIQRLIFALLILAFPIPPYVHTAGWVLALQSLGITSHGIPVAWWCMTMCFLPLSSIAVYAAVETLDHDLLEAAALTAQGPACLFRVILPLSLPLVAAAVLLVFCLNLLDYTIPSLCQVNVYPLRIFADFSLFAQPGRSFLLSLPLLFIGFPVFLVMGQGLKHVGAGIRLAARGQLRLQWPLAYRLAAILGLLVLAAQLGIPLIALLKQARQANMDEHFFRFLPALGYSFYVAFCAALLSVLIGYPTAVILSERQTWGIVLWPLLIFPWIIPASLNGVGWITLAGKTPFLSGSTLLLVLGEASRFVSVAVFLIWGFCLRTDRELLNAARLLSPSWLRNVLKIDVPLVLPGILAGAFLVTALTLGELGTAVILSPPGWETFTVRIYNYLHYGAKGHVAAACLTMMILTMLLGCAAKTALDSKYHKTA